MLYAAPTSNGHIAHTVLPNGGGGCGTPGPDGLELGRTRTERGTLVVFGLVGDVVESVDLVVGDVTHEARIGENAFGLRFERTPEADLERVVLHRRDDTTNEIELAPK